MIEQQASQIESPFLTVAEAAQILKVSRDTIIRKFEHQQGVIDLAKWFPGEGVVGGDLAIVRTHRGCHLTLGLLSNHVTSCPDMGCGEWPATHEVFGT